MHDTRRVPSESRRKHTLTKKEMAAMEDVVKEYAKDFSSAEMAHIGNLFFLYAKLRDMEDGNASSSSGS